MGGLEPPPGYATGYALGLIIASLKFTQTMKFGIAKLPKTFYKNTEKRIKRKKKQQQRIKLIRG